MSEVLALRGVSKGYNRGKPNEISVLAGLDLSLSAGELVALEAPSGSGKSTLLHIAGLLDTADAGQVIIDGAEATKSDRQRTGLRRATLGFVYQFHHLLPEFTALENILLPQLSAGVSRAAATKRAMGLLGEVGLEARATHRPAELSGGEQQRAARAGLWVATRAAMPSRRTRRKSASKTVSEVSGSRLPVGSSARSTLGALATAR
ncbi:MAG: ATP-binding cassette domain-containing protein, partial [Pseudomonadota bacterium]